MHSITRFKTQAQGLEGWLAVDNGLTVGHIFMQEEPDFKLKFLDAWIHPAHRRKGIYRSLWETRWSYVSSAYPDYTVYAWCKDSSLPLLLEKGFIAGESCTYVERKVVNNISGPRVPVTC